IDYHYHMRSSMLDIIILAVEKLTESNNK
ncbi:hypothetical protein A2U01_0088707, partial [Trifolium medium]|nr:hypothetical protein [Trifolium medium]